MQVLGRKLQWGNVQIKTGKLDAAYGLVKKFFSRYKSRSERV